MTGNTHFCTHRTLSQIPHTAVQEGCRAQLHSDVADRVVIKVGFRETLELLEIGVPQLLPLRVSVR
jgi:hypothetical protein